MKIECKNGLGPTAVHSGDWVLVRSEKGDPLALIVQLGPEHYIVADLADPDFERTLKEFGVPAPKQVRRLTDQEYVEALRPHLKGV